MPESKSGALTNLATPQQSIAYVTKQARRKLYRILKKKTERVDTIPLMKRIALFAKLSLAANN